MNILLALFFVSASNVFNLPPGLLASVCFVESSHNVFAVHLNDGSSDSLGVCQVHTTTARWLGFEGEENDLMDPQTNIYYAAKYLNYQISRYHGNISKALVAYNRGNAKGLTRSEYSDKVLKQWSSYEQ